MPFHPDQTVWLKRDKDYGDVVIPAGSPGVVEAVLSNNFYLVDFGPSYGDRLAPEGDLSARPPADLTRPLEPKQKVAFTRNINFGNVEVPKATEATVRAIHGSGYVEVDVGDLAGYRVVKAANLKPADD